MNRGDCRYMPSSFRPGLWLVLLTAAMLSELDLVDYWWNSDNCLLHEAGLFGLMVFKATLLTFLYGLSEKRAVWKWIMRCVIGAFILLSIVNGFSFIFFGFGITRKMMIILLETNPREAEEFFPELGAAVMSSLKSPYLWLTICALGLLYEFLTAIPRKIWISLSVGISLVGIVYAIYVMTSGGWGKTNISVFARSARCAVSARQTLLALRELQRVPRALPDADELKSEYLAKRVFLVIGESASRDHLALYGYGLPTTPSLDSVRNGLFIFEDALAPSMHTIYSLPRLLSYQTDEPSAGEWYEYPTVLQLLKNIGYRTYWLSNQEKTGEYSNLTTILSSDADEVSYLGMIDREDYLIRKYDDVLLPAFRDVQGREDSLQLVCLHLMGSHFQYDQRYPADRAFFNASDVLKAKPRSWLDSQKAGIVANYDNSILYTDSILGEIVHSLESVSEPSLMIYLSDHGEDVYDRGDFRGRAPEAAGVPFIIYANPAYIRNNPSVVEDMERSISNPFSTSELPNILLHLTGTQYPLYDSIRDPLSAGFMKRTRYIDGESELDLK